MADQNDDFQQQVPPQDPVAPQPLPQDFSTPAADPADAAGTLNVDHPSADSNVEPSEKYDEGQADAAVDNPATPVSETPSEPTAPVPPAPAPAPGAVTPPETTPETPPENNSSDQAL